MSPKQEEGKGRRKKNDDVNDDGGSASGSLLVVNMRGLVNTRRPVRKTLEQLRLIKRFNATIVPDNEVYRGMLESAKEHVAWCKLDAKTAEALLSKRAESSTGNRVDESVLRKKDSEFSSFSDLATALAGGKTTLSEDLGFRQFFRLSPPRGGFKRSIRRQFGEGGILGPNKELPSVVEKMITV
jgi:large subunit ribosomal protein L30